MRSAHPYYGYSAPQRITDDTREWVIGVNCVLAVVAVLGLLLATAILDGQGRKPWHHATAVPAAATRITNDTYIVPAGFDPSQICRGGTSGGGSGSAVASQVTVPKLHGTFIKCYRDQSWNDHRKPSVNFYHAGRDLLTNPKLWIAIGGAYFFFALFLWIPKVARDNTAWRHYAKQKRIDVAAQIEIVKTQWAQDKITTDEFERKMAELVAQEKEVS